MITLSSINKSFQQRTVLSNLSLSIKENEFVCIVGESGLGKTTLLNIIGLLDQPDSGIVSLNGNTNFTKRDVERLRRTFFGYIFQDFLLMPDKSVEDNIKVSQYGKGKFDQKFAGEIMDKVGLDASYLSENVSHLSGGEQQKVAIARMLMKPYELVLADEPTGNLDHKNKMEVIEILKGIQKDGKTIVCVTHDQAVADSADRVIDLSKL